ncbi:AmmeMemoRadiSam system radical SAM enzyme [Candidatus Berkelbacteria bacterium CG_4_8_14_3_um_filter_42_13]|uniref:AmmeMemoRadiSam system radical SAM enzyme n=3 Tax=Candidatus Berkelbacteria TaxID=1618330 RepID=A0A2M7K1F8_9BACT|nr:MAG: AmmeMemoRadiSam system radical SAM enzyme [Candidatus Berkelbacteria bacterium CG_4_8_14_3_um_filter_42_13]
MLYKKLKDKSVRCLACAHYCQIAPDGFGICGTRQNQNGKLVSRVYGHVAAIHVDPIEKKPLYHFMPGSEILSIGTLGCNFRCPWCQNWDISQATKQRNKPKNWGQKISPEEIVELAKKYKTPAVAYTYNEPAIFIEFAHDTAKLAHRIGLKNIFVTNGFLSKESFEYIKPYLDAANVDLKSMDDKFYQKFCGARLQPVLDTIRRFHDAKIHIEITTLIIPGVNDSDANLKKIAKFISGIDKKIPWHISRFYPAYKMADTPPTPLKFLDRAAAIGQQAGLEHIYIGNI